MKHIFGMAKSSLDLRGAKAQKLELDFLRLAYAVDHYRRDGSEAQGYLLVLAPELHTRVAAWSVKYAASATVQCIAHTMAEVAVTALRLEKAANVAGMVAGTQGEDPGRRSDASLGHDLAERALREAIVAAEPGVDERTRQADLPFGVRWDFYGVIASSPIRVA